MVIQVYFSYPFDIICNEIIYKIVLAFACITIGGANVAEVKKIIVSLPNNLLKQIDYIIAYENKNRNEFIQEAMKLYIKEREKLKIREQLKLGYVKMAQVNIEFAELGICADCKDFVMYESRLSECE